MGLEVDEPAVDLGVVAAITSSFRSRPIDPHTAVFGEVGLTGEVRATTQAGVRAREAQALGFKTIVMPASNTAGLERMLGLRAIGVRSVEEALELLFSAEDKTKRSTNYTKYHVSCYFVDRFLSSQYFSDACLGFPGGCRLWTIPRTPAFLTKLFPI